jgi:hypothetical protein
MTGKPREARKAVCITARMRNANGWSDVTIHNVSSRGLMARAQSPASKGDYIEICRGHVAITGRVVWSNGSSFGVRSREAIDLAALEGRPEAGATRAAGERRTVGREAMLKPRPVDLAARAEQSRRIGQALQWTMLAVAVAVGSIMVMQAAFTALSAPLRQVRAALAVSAQP